MPSTPYDVGLVHSHVLPPSSTLVAGDLASLGVSARCDDRGWPIAAAQSGRLHLRIGFRDTALIDVAIALVGSVLTALLPQDAAVWQVAASTFLTGIGMGLSSSPAPAPPCCPRRTAGLVFD